MTERDEARLSRVEDEGDAFLRLLLQLEPLLEDPRVLTSVRFDLFKYIQEGKHITRRLIREDLDQDITQSQILELNERGAVLSKTVDELNERSYEHFESAMRRSEEDSRLMLRVGLWSSISGIFLVGVISGIIIRLNRRLAQANENLEKEVHARTEELESFVYTVSHDLKSPVVSMHGMASILAQRHGHELNEKVKYYLDRIIFNANYMEELILGLLTLSRIGQKQPDLKMADAREVVQEILNMNKERFAEKGIEVILQSPLPHFLFDRLLLTQSFQNLITNAAKFMGDQPHPLIEIGGRESDGKVEFYVKDNGIGIDPAYHEKIFGVFQRLKEVEVEGTGVGLSIVKKIVDLAGGKIWVESQKGEGTTFFLQLPRKEYS